MKYILLIFVVVYMCEAVYEKPTRNYCVRRNQTRPYTKQTKIITKAQSFKNATGIPEYDFVKNCYCKKTPARLMSASNGSQAIGCLTRTQYDKMYRPTKLSDAWLTEWENKVEGSVRKWFEEIRQPSFN